MLSLEVVVSEGELHPIDSPHMFKKRSAHSQPRKRDLSPEPAPDAAAQLDDAEDKVE